MKKPLGSIVWTDLTVDNAESIRDFYSEVVGWKHQGLSMGEYEDYVMKANEEDGGTSGICHARGMNANVPAQWMIYATVADIQTSVKTCLELGGKVLDGPRMMSKNEFAVIQDPAGAVMGIITDIA